MAFPLVVIILLDRVCQCVPEVQEHPLAGVELVRLDHDPLDIHAPGDHTGQFAFQVVKRRVGAEKIKQSGVLDAAVLDHFAHPVFNEMLRQRVQHLRINEHKFRLKESADQVLPLGKVHRHLAAHGRVHLGEKRSGDLYELYSPEIAGCGKSGQIADHSAAECDHKVAPGQLRI